MNESVYILFILRTVLMGAASSEQPPHLCKESFRDGVKYLTEASNEHIEIAKRSLVLVDCLDQHELVH